MTFMAKDEPQPGNADYLEWNLSEDPSDFTNYTEHLADVSLFNWHNYEGKSRVSWRKSMSRAGFSISQFLMCVYFRKPRWKAFWRTN